MTGWLLLGLVAAGAAAACPNEDVQPGQISVSDYATTLLCVVNETRAEWGRPQLEFQGTLIRAANGFAAEMVEQHFFSHDAPNGEMYADRLDAAGFIPPSDKWRWRAGEDLAAGHGAEVTPAAVVSAWMYSSEHRANLLDGGFTLAGIGVARGWPGASDDPNGMTVVLDLGLRQPKVRAARAGQ